MMDNFKKLTQDDLANLTGGVILGPLAWFKLLPPPKGKTPSGLIIL